MGRSSGEVKETTRRKSGITLEKLYGDMWRCQSSYGWISGVRRVSSS
jgi:hypothetical protein